MSWLFYLSFWLMLNAVSQLRKYEYIEKDFKDSNRKHEESKNQGIKYVK